MRKSTFVVFVVLFVLALVLPALADDDTWHKDWKKLGEETASVLAEKDSIRCDDAGKLRKLRLQVKETGITFDEVKVHLRDGRTLNWKVPDFLPAGAFDTLDLPGDGEKVDKVTFRYRKNLLKDERARLILWGKKD
jgi:hypothetical protein